MPSPAGTHHSGKETNLLDASEVVVLAQETITVYERIPSIGELMRPRLAHTRFEPGDVASTPASHDGLR
jgi:hypothetical protein